MAATRTLPVVSVLLFVALAIWAESSENWKITVRPIAENCKESTNATDEDVETLVQLKSDFSEEAKCLVACLATTLGTFKDGGWAPFQEHLDVYEGLFADDPKRLAVAQHIVENCTFHADEKFPDNPCRNAHDTIMCLMKASE